ncbi:MAG: GlcNAc-PI de-N-acetylase [Dethiosulfovibrio peptidovorans]|nr:MAG: GlcNAc-PI de-N-acetylase [Dethiosulfovibrio peptidovorans]
MNRSALVVAAHPDDEVLGCGGTMARLADDGWDVDVLILGEGITSRDGIRDAQKHVQDLEMLKETAQRANSVLGVRDVLFGDLPDNRFDIVPLLDVVKIVERCVDDRCPTMVFTHYEGDLNVDHRVTVRAVKTATRPMRGCPVVEVLSFSVLSSTEWNFGASVYAPQVFYDISTTLERKKQAMAAYTGELREWPHPRSLPAIEHEARGRGSVIGGDAAEGFVLLRSVR